MITAAMVWVFWGAAIAIGVMDIVAALKDRKTLSNVARDKGRATPSLAYGAGVLVTHFWLSNSLLPWYLGMGVVLAGAGVVALTRHALGVRFHPMIAVVFGMILGTFWSN